MPSSLAPSLLALLACPALRALRPCHRAAWGAFLGALFGLSPRAAGAWGAFWRGSPASVVQDLDASTAADARAFRAFVRRARRIARELEHGATGASLSAENDTTTAHAEGARA